MKSGWYSQLKREKLRRERAPRELPGEADPEAQFLDKSAAQGIHRILHGLREPYKEVFWLKTFGELSFREIGDLFGKSESWGRVTYYRAKIMIKEELK